MLAEWRSCLGYRHAGCLQLAGHQRCADCGPVDPPQVELPSAGAYRLAAFRAITCSLFRCAGGVRCEWVNFSSVTGPPG